MTVTERKEGRSVLVTGGFGFLGRATARLFKSRGWRVVGVGNGRWDSSEAAAQGLDSWLDAGVTVPSLLTLGEKFDLIVHCAGNGSVGYSIGNPLQDFMKTVSGTAELLEYVRTSNPEALVVYPSSAGVYGAKEDAPISESASLNPISPYGFHKRMAEELCHSYARNYGVRVAIIRFFSIYGAGLTKQLLWDASHKLTSSEDAVVFWGTGEETRDWIHVADATELIWRVAQQEEPFAVYNGASGRRMTVRATLELLRRELGAAHPIAFNGKVKEGDPRFYHADISRAQRLGFQETVSLTEGIRRYVNWFKEYHCDDKSRLSY